MMNKADFIKMLQKYFKGNATRAERHFILNYYELFDAEPDILNLLKDGQKEDLKVQLKDSIWKSINQHEQKSQKVKPMYQKWVIIPAAIIVLTILITGIISLLNNKIPVQQDFTTHSEQNHKHKLIRLPDGSIAILDVNSKLDYKSSFENSATREVYLEGQAYFDVKHNTLKPFIVHAGDLKTTVLGTSFNIKAWPTDVDVSVTVSKGSVNVSDQKDSINIIVQNQQIRYIKDKADFIQREVDAKAFLIWKDQDLLVEDITLSEVVELLEDRFDVKIIIDQEVLRPDKFTITFLKNENLEQALKSICEFHNADYIYDKEKATVIITPKYKS